jgi:hypothetical protein
MAKAYANRVWMTTATSGTGTITLGSAKAGYLTPAEAGVPNADTVTYCIIDGNDFELGTGTYTTSGTTLSRDTVTVSKIGGTAGTTKLTLSGSAEVFLTNDQDETAFLDRANTFTANQRINGRIGINADPDYELTINSTNANTGFNLKQNGTFALSIYALAANYAVMNAAANTPFIISIDGNQRARVDDNVVGSRFQLLSQDAGATRGPIKELFRDSASPAASDVIGQVLFTGRNSAAARVEYATIQSVITDPTSTTEDADLVFETIVAGALAERMRLSAGNLTLTGNAIYYQAEQAEVGTTYTLALTDANKMVTLSNGSAITLTVPTNASIPFPIGTRIDIAQFGAGQVSVTSSATIRSEGSKLKLRGQYSVATLWKKGTDEWLLAGDIVA